MSSLGEDPAQGYLERALPATMAPAVATSLNSNKEAGVSVLRTTLLPKPHC